MYQEDIASLFTYCYVGTIDRPKTSFIHFYSNEDIKVFHWRKVKMYLYTLLLSMDTNKIYGTNKKSKISWKINKLLIVQHLGTLSLVLAKLVNILFVSLKINQSGTEQIFI